MERKRELCRFGSSFAEDVSLSLDSYHWTSMFVYLFARAESGVLCGAGVVVWMFVRVHVWWRRRRGSFGGEGLVGV